MLQGPSQLFQHALGLAGRAVRGMGQGRGHFAVIHRAGVSKPKVLKHQIYEIIFDEENRVIEVQQYDLSNFKEIDYNDKETATKGNEQNLFEMIVRSSSKLPN